MPSSESLVHFINAKIGLNNLTISSQAMLFRVLLSTFLSLAAAAPQVKLGDTTLIGRDVTLRKQDFFGGKCPTTRRIVHT